MQSIESKMLSRIYGHGRGWVFTPGQFIDISEPKSVGVYLGRLVSEGKIQRLARGLYCYPEQHPKLGALVPPAEQIARVIAKRDGIKLLPSGAYAANRLRLSEQVPAKVVFHTDGKSRKISIGETTIEFRKASPRCMALAGKESGVVIQALKYLGVEHVDDSIVQRLRTMLSDDVKQDLIKSLSLVPAWMRGAIKEVAEVS